MTMSKQSEKFFKALLTTTVAVSGVAVIAPIQDVQADAITFKDVKKADYFNNGVQDLVQKGFISGYEDGTFKPGQYITRAHVAKILANYLELEVNNVKDPGFTDVNKKNPYYAEIAAVVEAGIFKGYDDKKFKPNKFITRAQIAQVLVEAFDLKLENYNNLPFTDISMQKPYANHVQTLYNNKITKGITTTTFGPSKFVTRGQFVAFIDRIVNINNNSKFELSIMHYNDSHSHVEQMPKLVTAVNEVRAKNSEALLLNAGDVFSGTLYFNEFQGQADLAFMNLLKVDAMTFGNHEFDLGSTSEGHKALADFIKAANFPFVTANVDFSKDSLFKGLFNTKISTDPKNANIYSGIVKEVDGEKVGIFGLTTAETKDISSPGSIAFKDYVEEAKTMVAEFEKIGVDKIVAITHIGYDDNVKVDNDIALAKAVEGIDVIVGGHSHTQLNEPVIIRENTEPTIIVQAYQYSDFLGTLDVTFDNNGVVVEHNGKLIKIADKIADSKATEIFVEYEDKIKEIQEEKIGISTVSELENPRTGGDDSKPSVRKNETPLGNLITDGMLAKAKTYNNNVIMAFQNGGGIRAAIEAGPITVGEVITVLPFGNTLATMELSGADLKAAFEISFKSYPSENGGFLHVAGAKVQFNSTKPAGERVVSIAYKNADGTYTEIEDSKAYTVATNAFTAKGGDSYDVFAKAYGEGRVTDLGLSDWENFRDHLVSLRTVNPQLEGRIIDIAVK